MWVEEKEKNESEKPTHKPLGIIEFSDSLNVSLMKGDIGDCFLISEFQSKGKMGGENHENKEPQTWSSEKLTNRIYG